MFINSLILALSSSIDSLGIGITYGIKNTRISYMAKIVLFVISFLISFLSVCFGDILKNIFSDFATRLIGNIILIAMGIFVCFQAIHKDKKNTTQNLAYSEPICKNNEKIYSFFIEFLGITIKIIKNPTSSDLDSSHSIDSKEALFLGFALFPVFISIFQLVFLSIGNMLGKKLHRLSNLPDNIWSVISGILLVLIGVVRFVV